MANWSCFLRKPPVSIAIFPLTAIILAILFGGCGSSSKIVRSSKLKKWSSADSGTVAQQDSLFKSSKTTSEVLEFLRLGRSAIADSNWFEAADKLDSGMAHLSALVQTDSLHPMLAAAVHRYQDTTQALLVRSITEVSVHGKPEDIDAYFERAIEEVPDSSLHDLDTLMAKLDYREFTLPVPKPIPERVLKAIKVFTGSGRGYFSKWMHRKSRYDSLITLKLKARGMPTDLIFLAMVESGFSPSAWSRAKASGVWQFISGTGRRYGLKDDWWEDPRRDVDRATDAALSYLEDLYAEFNDWPLAMAAYNCGEGRVRRYLARNPLQSYWDMPLPEETRFYVPKILAAMIISHNPDRFNFSIDKPEAPLEYDTVTVNHCLSLSWVAKTVGTSEDSLRSLNPALRRWCTPPHAASYRVYLPVGTRDAFIKAYQEVDKNSLVSWQRHTVKRGEVLGSIARKYAVSPEAIQSANSMRGKRIFPGQSLVIPIQGNGGNISQQTMANEGDDGEEEIAPPSKPIVRGNYRVKRGETLYDLARRFKVSVSQIRLANGMDPRDGLLAGKNLKIPTASDLTETPEVSEAPTNTKTQRKVHRVASGESLYELARRYRVSVEDLKKWNGLDNGVIKVGQTLALQTVAESNPVRKSIGRFEGSHSVSSGDTYFEIALLYGISVEELLQANNRSTDHVLKAGEMLKVPGRPKETSEKSQERKTPLIRKEVAAYYVVRAGDTLWDISNRFGCSVESLRELNVSLKNRDLRPGQRLRIR